MDRVGAELSESPGTPESGISTGFSGPLLIGHLFAYYPRAMLEHLGGGTIIPQGLMGSLGVVEPKPESTEKMSVATG